MDERGLDAAWKKYKETGDGDARNDLLLHYMELVRQIVRRMMPKYNAYNEFDDLVNCGMIGLIDAVDRFDPAQGVKFETYAVMRIRGEVIDYIRSQDWAPTSLRRKISAINEAGEAIERDYGRTADEAEVAKAVGLSVEQVRKVQNRTHIFNVVSFEDAVGAAFAEEAAGPEDENPEEVFMNSELLRNLAAVIEDLPEKEKLVISLYYYDELMLKDIAEVLKVTESRVSQIHSKVLSKLKAALTV